jgi:hypothetical protein
MKILSPTMNISGGSAIISGGAGLLLIGYLLYRQTPQSEARAVTAEVTAELLRAEVAELRSKTASLRNLRRRNRRRR